jgi:hypothetical protein
VNNREGRLFLNTQRNAVPNRYHHPTRRFTGGGRSDDQQKIIYGGKGYSGCLAWIEDGLTAPDAGFSIVAEECEDADLKAKVRGEEVANIWAACDGSKDQPAKEQVECRLLQGEGCSGDLGSVDFKTGYVWSKKGFDFIEVSVDVFKEMNAKVASEECF